MEIQKVLSNLQSIQITRKSSIKLRLTMGVLTVLILSMIGINSLILSTVRENVNKSFESQAITLVSAINSSIGTKSQIDTKSNEIEKTFYKLLESNSSVAKITLYSPVGNTYIRTATTDPAKKGKEADPYDTEPITTGKPLFIEKPEKEQVEILAPIFVEEQQSPYATIGVYFYTAERESLYHTSLLKILLVSIAGFLAISLLIYKLSEKLVFRRIHDLSSAFRSIFKGDYSHRINSKKEDEIGELVREFNGMAEMLENRYYTSITDPLTGLYNQFYFNSQIDQEIKRNYNGEFSLLFIDVDHFKKINDQFGHIEGDSILKKIADIIQEHLKDQDILARYGGEEFVALIPNAAQDRAISIANRIRSAIASYPLTNGLMPVTISIGVSTYPANGQDKQSLIYSADQALYAAKAQGRNKVVFSGSQPLDTNESSGFSENQYDTATVKEMIYAFAAAMDAKDVYTQKHSETVSRYSAAIGARLGLTELEVKRISIAGLLHDVGKIGVPDAILNKPSRLTDEEFEIIKLHPTLGKNILEHISSINDILDYVEFHQERYDGKGYPKGLKGDEIPLGARIVSVADAFHAMTSSRPYRISPLTFEQAINELRKNAGTQFDPKVAESFITLVNEWKWETDQHGNLSLAPA